MIAARKNKLEKLLVALL